MDNLPKDNQNNDSNITTNNPGANLDPIKEPVPPIETPETPPEKQPENIPNIPGVQPEVQEEINQKIPDSPPEKTIEIGSLDEQPTFSTLNQGTINQTDSNPSSGKKNNKGKIITSVLAILLIIAALPTTVILVKQRQDIRKNASESQAAFSDITITFESETAPSAGNGGTYSTTFKVANTVSSTRTVTVEKKSCYCSSGSPSACNDNCSSANATLSLGGNQSTNVTISARQPDGSICGAFQTDLTVKSVN